MGISESLNKLHGQLKCFEDQRAQIENKIKETPRIQDGAINFNYYCLSKKQEKIEEYINRINSILKPDIIA